MPMPRDRRVSAPGSAGLPSIQYSVCRQLKLGVAYQNAPLIGNFTNGDMSRRRPSCSWSCWNATASAFRPASSQGRSGLLPCKASRGNRR